MNARPTCILLVLAMLLAGGCAREKVHSFNLTVEMDEQIGGDTATVHLVGVSAEAKADWETIPMSEYWKPGNARRRAAEVGPAVTMNFGPEKRSNTLYGGDPIWKKWKDSYSARYLFLMADLPDPTHTGRAGAEDPWRYIFDLHEDREGEVIVTLHADGMTVRTAGGEPPK